MARCIRLFVLLAALMLTGCGSATVREVPVEDDPAPPSSSPRVGLAGRADGFGLVSESKGDSDSDEQVYLLGGQLRVCWAVTGDVRELMILVGDAKVRADAGVGCSFAREKTGDARVEVRFLGVGRWAVRVEEQGRPEGLVRVPALGSGIGAEGALVAAGLVAAVRTGCEPREPAGALLGVSPRSGAAVAQGSTVILTVNQPSSMPSVIGKRPADAERAVTGVGLLVDVSYVSVGDDDKPSPSVVGQYPDAGTPICAGKSVTIDVERR